MNLRPYYFLHAAYLLLSLLAPCTIQSAVGSCSYEELQKKIEENNGLCLSINGVVYMCKLGSSGADQGQTTEKLSSVVEPVTDTVKKDQGLVVSTDGGLFDALVDSFRAWYKAFKEKREEMYECELCSPGADQKQTSALYLRIAKWITDTVKKDYDLVVETGGGLFGTFVTSFHDWSDVFKKGKEEAVQHVSKEGAKGMKGLVSMEWEKAGARIMEQIPNVLEEKKYFTKVGILSFDEATVEDLNSCCDCKLVTLENSVYDLYGPWEEWKHPTETALKKRAKKLAPEELKSYYVGALKKKEEVSVSQPTNSSSRLALSNKPSIRTGRLLSLSLKKDPSICLKGEVSAFRRPSTTPPAQLEGEGSPSPSKSPTGTSHGGRYIWGGVLVFIGGFLYKRPLMKKGPAASTKRKRGVK